MQWSRGVGLLWGAVTDPVPVAVTLVLQREMGLLVMVRVGFGGMLCAAVAIIVWMWSPPDLTLLCPSGRTLFLVTKAPLSDPLLRVGQPSCLFREVTVAPPSTHVVVRVAPTLGTHRRWCLIGCPRA